MLMVWSCDVCTTYFQVDLKISICDIFLHTHTGRLPWLRLLKEARKTLLVEMSQKEDYKLGHNNFQTCYRREMQSGVFE